MADVRLKPARPAFAGSSGRDPAGADVAIWGVPTDCGAGTGRLGAAGGPRVIRAASHTWNTVRTSAGFEFAKHGRVADLGDLDLSRVRRGRVHEFIRAGAPELAAGRLTVAIGGDHSVTLPILEAAAGSWALVYLDAHPDCIDHYHGDRRSHACTLRRLVEAGRVDPAKSTVLGMRAPEAEEVEWLAAHGVQAITAWEIRDEGIEEACRSALCRAGDGPVYLSIDMDVLDAACVPGVENPEPGGISSAEALWACAALAPHARAADLVEVTADCDPAGITAKTAARMLLDMVGAYIGSSRVAGRHAGKGV